MSILYQFETIKKRYIHERAIYTWCGIALVAVNPYLEQDIYGEQVIETYHSASHSVYLQLDPHIYAITEDAYSKLDLHSKDQSIIVSGESGAGKTVSAKHAMRYLASIAGSTRASKLRIEDRVLASNPIMEAIGNASTVRNDNSSRFGKYIQIYFDRHRRRILGASMRTYLLEKSRVTNQQPGERNFHIFYQLLNYANKNPMKMSHLMLLDPQNSNRIRDFKLLAGLEPIDSSDDLRRFNEALKTLNIDEQRIDVIYKIVAGILHGGNIEFKPIVNETNGDDVDDETPCTIDMDDFHFKACCELIGLDPEETRKRLTVKLLRSGARDIIEQPQSIRKAEYARDAMLKYIYECLFNWLVALINHSLSSKSTETPETELPNANNISTPATPLKSPLAKKSILDHQQPQFIGVLDIYGFENFKTNSFEQFCINYANEVLQQQYNQHVFKIEQEEYIREGIDWTFIEYSDNQPVIDIIESKPIGILNLLDEECRMPKGSDQSWCAKLYDHLLPTPSKKSANNDTVRFKKPKLNYQNSFIICHYAEDVNYDVARFLEKNRDTMAEEQYELLRSSDVLSYVFEDPSLQVSFRPKMRSSRSATVGCQFRGSLAALIRTLNATEPHYIRCIKPNDEKKAFEINEERAHQQLRACGVYETIRISNNGFPSRWYYKDFAKRYCILIYGTPAFQELVAASQARRRAQQVAEASDVGAAASDDDKSAAASDEAEDDEDDDEWDSAEQSAAEIIAQPAESSRHFIRQFSSADVRPICEAICKQIYDEDSIYGHLRTDEERDYIEQLKVRHGNQASAIYQFGKTKIFFRAGQVGFLERVRGQRLREYALTIQRHVRGWLARRSFRQRREENLEHMRREASLILAQNQLNSLQTELEQVKEEREELTSETNSHLGSMYQLVIDMMYASIQPLIIGAVLEYEALDSPVEPFSSLDSSSSRSLTPNDENNNSSNYNRRHSMEYLIKELDRFFDLISKNCVPEETAVQIFRQIFHLICTHSLNQLLIRRDLCQFRKAMQINFNLSCLVQWCREHYLVRWREIVDQLDPITQATKLLQTRKSTEDISTIEEVCNKLKPSQIIKILNMYESTYGEQITIDFIRQLEDYLNKTRSM
jgi:myosin heavy subunit